MLALASRRCLRLPFEVALTPACSFLNFPPFSQFCSSGGAITPMSNDILTIREVAEYLKINEKTAYRLAAEGKLPGFKVGGAWRFRKDEIERLTRAETHSDPERDEGREGDGREEVAGELVVTSCDAPEVLQPAEGCLNAPTPLVADLVVVDRHLPVQAPWNDDIGTFGVQASA